MSDSSMPSSDIGCHNLHDFDLHECHINAISIEISLFLIAGKKIMYFYAYKKYG
jgi:hypothetical protein